MIDDLLPMVSRPSKVSAQPRCALAWYIREEGDRQNIPAVKNPVGSCRRVLVPIAHVYNRLRFPMREMLPEVIQFGL